MPEQNVMRPPLTLSRLAGQIPDAVLEGNGDLTVQELVHPRMAASGTDMVLIMDPAALELFQQPHPVKAAIISEEIPVPEGMFEGIIRVKRPRFALVPLLKIFEKPVHAAKGIHPSAVVEATAQVDPSASVGAFVYVGPQAVIGPNTILMPHVTVGAQAVLGADCLLHSGVRVGERVIVGNRVIMHQNASVGADGFSYVTPHPGSIESAKTSGGKVTAQNMEIFKINSIGTVVLEDDVEVGACATIDRANVGATIVRKGTKIDNLVMIGHNNMIGENCLIVSQTGISGSCQIGDRVVIAGQSGIADHLKVGDDAIVMAKSGVMRDVHEREVVVGVPALPRREFMQNVAYVGRLREMFQEIKFLKKRLAELEEKYKEPMGV